MSPIAVLGAAIVFGITVAATRFISLGSVLAAMSAPLLVLMLNQPQPIFLATLFIAALIVWRHRSNIKRLMDGSEDRFKA
jgi:glycerol-3-phosphate acyltransferase PlsY